MQFLAIAGSVQRLVGEISDLLDSTNSVRCCISQEIFPLI